MAFYLLWTVFHEMRIPHRRCTVTVMRNIALSPIAPVLGKRVPVRGPARLLLHSYAKSRVRPGEAVRTVTTRLGDHFEVDLSSLLEWYLWAFGDYEKHFAELFQHLVRPGSTCIDVGANIGIHTTRLAKLAGTRGRVVAIEADEELTRRLIGNVGLNNLMNVNVVHAAASDSGGGASTLYRPDDRDPNKGRASLVRHDYLTGSACSVRTVTLDDLVHEPVALIKIDVEGYEAAVLGGAKRIVAEYHPSIVFEYWPNLLADGPGLIKWVAGQGYELLDIRAVRNRVTGQPRLTLVPLKALPRTGTDLLAVSGSEMHRLRSFVETRLPTGSYAG